MELIKKSEWFKFNKPIGEPDIIYYDKEYHIERLVDIDNNYTIWFGLDTNWKRDIGSEQWEFLLMGKFYPCDQPIYEKLYMEKYGR